MTSLQASVMLSPLQIGFLERYNFSSLLYKLIKQGVHCLKLLVNISMFTVWIPIMQWENVWCTFNQCLQWLLFLTGLPDESGHRFATFLLSYIQIRYERISLQFRMSVFTIYTIFSVRNHGSVQILHSDTAYVALYISSISWHKI